MRQEKSLSVRRCVATHQANQIDDAAAASSSSILIVECTGPATRIHRKRGAKPAAMMQGAKCLWGASMPELEMH